MYRNIEVRHDGPVARLILNRPEKRNALSLELMEEVLRALDAIAASAARVIVVEGAGPAFSAGHDLSELTGRDVSFYQHLFDVCSVLMQRLHSVPQPVIAKVHGVEMATSWICSRCQTSVNPSEKTCPKCLPLQSYPQGYTYRGNPINFPYQTGPYQNITNPYVYPNIVVTNCW